MRVVMALGGNALLKRGEPMTAATQRANVRIAASAIAKVMAAGHQVIITHGNGPQVGLLALQSAAYDREHMFPLDVLDAETEGMIGYLIEQELGNLLPEDNLIATLLTQIEVDPEDQAFRNPQKPIGPQYDKAAAEKLARERQWHMAADGKGYRRVVPSPLPLRILEIKVIELLVRQGVTVICAGGGGIPVVRKPDHSLLGVEAVIDKDLASSHLASELQADVLLMLTDVDHVYRGWPSAEKAPIATATPHELKAMTFEKGSMAPKIDAAIAFIEKGGVMAGIGNLSQALDILEQRAGTRIAA
jgi:carbamate kinase